MGKRKSRCLATEYPKDFLETARLLRRHLRENAGGADDFARKIYGGYDISLGRFEGLTLARVGNSGQVAGVFELDFDRQVVLCRPRSGRLEKLLVPGCQRRRLPGVPQGAQLSGGALAEICVPT